MLIVDIINADGESFRVGGIGTCRLRDIIVDLSPEAKASPPIEEGLRSVLAWRGFNAFAHTSMQALQYYKVFNSEIELPEFVESLAYNRTLTPQILEKIQSAGRIFFPTIDAYFIEIATLNVFSWNGFYFNQNYLERNLVRKGGKPLLKWLRSLSTQSDDHEENVAETLSALPFGNLENTEHNRSLIRGMRKSVQTQEELFNSLLDLKKQVKRPVVVVTPFLLEEDSDRRVAFASLIESAAIQAGCRTYTITKLIERLGRAEILAGDGADINHFRQGVHATLLKDMYETMEDHLQAIKQSNTLQQAS